MIYDFPPDMHPERKLSVAPLAALIIAAVTVIGLFWL